MPLSRAVTPNIHRMVGKASLDAMSNGEAPIRLPDFLLAAIEKRFDWPGDGQLLTNLAVSYPIQLALSIYLYADLLAEYALTPTWPGVLVILAAAVGLLHLELARKVTRKPRDGERTYVRIRHSACRPDRVVLRGAHEPDRRRAAAADAGRDRSTEIQRPGLAPVAVALCGVVHPGDVCVVPVRGPGDAGQADRVIDRRRHALVAIRDISVV
ncbi:hypothetical protein [Burkholderia ubonensis]|uniref:hypothetical protein n=1 Tax=Burkholderia ubonensis TaxID=101571 RepID=UPI000A499206|nr:hypothetical protein [Burkholderia ubonensis]